MGKEGSKVGMSRKSEGLAPDEENEVGEPELDENGGVDKRFLAGESDPEEEITKEDGTEFVGTGKGADVVMPQGLPSKDDNVKEEEVKPAEGLTQLRIDQGILRDAMDELVDSAGKVMEAINGVMKNEVVAGSIVFAPGEGQIVYRCPRCGWTGTDPRDTTWCPKCPNKVTVVDS